MDITIFEVGGSIRDELLGLPSCKDFDYVVVAPSFEMMEEYIRSLGYQIFLITGDYFTIRARRQDGQVADFVWARKEGPYSDGRHPDWVKPATLEEDLARRDFTMNAIARDPETGQLIDPFYGRNDIEDKVIRCVGVIEDRLKEDRLRQLRAIRFAITKEMKLTFGLHYILKNTPLGFEGVSIERIKDELYKCFKYSTPKTLQYIERFTVLFDPIFDSGRLWLEPTLKER